MPEALDLPQDPGDVQLPGRGDTLSLSFEETTQEVTLLLYDNAMNVWTVRDDASGELSLIRLDSDLNWQHISLDILHASSD